MTFIYAIQGCLKNNIPITVNFVYHLGSSFNGRGRGGWVNLILVFFFFLLLQAKTISKILFSKFVKAYIIRNREILFTNVTFKFKVKRNTVNFSALR